MHLLFQKKGKLKMIVPEDKEAENKPEHLSLSSKEQ